MEERPDAGSLGGPSQSVCIERELRNRASTLLWHSGYFTQGVATASTVARPCLAPVRRRLVLPSSFVPSEVCVRLAARIARASTIWTLQVATVCAVGWGGRALSQTVQLPPPAASSLDRLAQAPAYTLGPPPPAWDPYAPQAMQMPAATAMPTTMPSALGGQPGYPSWSTTAPSFAPTQPVSGQSTSSLFPQGSILENQTVQQTLHFYQGARGSWAYLFGSNTGTQLGVNELDTTATFAVPFFMHSQANINHAPLLITPGFGLQLWDGPLSKTTGQDLPSSTYDAFLDLAWNPQMTPLFGAEWGVRVGVFTNWDVFVTDSWRIMGRALGTLNLTPTMQGKVGIVYLDRNQVKLLPAVGLTWVPNASSRYDIFFPAPRASWRLGDFARRSAWLYLAGEYGGGAWTFRHAAKDLPSDGKITPFDYNDIRVSLGGELVPDAPVGLSGFFEVGYVFYRQLFYVTGRPQIVDLDSTLMLRTGLAY
jgi:hypothetical protein